MSTFRPNVTQTPEDAPQLKWEVALLVMWALTFTVPFISAVDNQSGSTLFNTLMLSGSLIALQGFVFGIHRLKMTANNRHFVMIAAFMVQVIIMVVLLLDGSSWWILHAASVILQMHLNISHRFAMGLDLLLLSGVFIQQAEFYGFTFLNLFLWIGVSAVGYIFGLWVFSILSDSEERRRLFNELTSTQANLVAAERREGVLEERSRLARDIHDTLAQGYIGVIMHLDAADEVQEDNPAKAEFHRSQAEQMAREGLKQARQVVNDLRPDILEENQTTADALRHLLENWSASANIATTFSENGTPVMPHPETELTILRTTQEGLANVLRHAQATKVQVTLSWIGDQVVLDIEDNGVGFDPETQTGRSETGGFGLTSMHERVAGSGGELHIESAPSEGTTLTIILPLG